MAKQPIRRPIRFDQFNKQLDDVGVGNLQEVQLSKDESIWIRLGNSIDQDDAEEFQARMRNAADSEEVALVVLDYYDGATAEEQWELFKSKGGTADRLAALFASATAQQQEDLGKLRPKRS
ncbi:hypothetical protein JTF08_13735 [Micrococcaceae bacterium RIT802]|nr:hypothetical protein [Micrococcaceae bacterium RIT 802]